MVTDNKIRILIAGVCPSKHNYQQRMFKVGEIRSYDYKLVNLEGPLTIYQPVRNRPNLTLTRSGRKVISADGFKIVSLAIITFWIWVLTDLLRR